MNRKKIEAIRLTQFSKNELENKNLNVLKGGKCGSCSPHCSCDGIPGNYGPGVYVQPNTYSASMALHYADSTNGGF
jgi:natural product precursor